MNDRAIYVILNAASGKKKTSDRARAVEAAAKARRDTTLKVLEAPRHLPREVRRALSDGYSTVVAAGGDGTICGVAQALKDSDAALGIVPLGTFNFFARGLGLPEDPAEALAVAAEGDAVPVLVGEVNGKLFLNNASLGAYAAVLQVREAVYRRWGRSRLAAYWSVLVAMSTLYRPLQMRITIDGRTVAVRSPMAFVAISAYQMDQYGFDGADAIRDGQFALLLAPDSGRLMLLWRAIKVLFRGVQKGRDYVVLTGREIEIETRRSHRLVARDGERERMQGPYRFRVRTDALRVRVPHPAPVPTTPDAYADAPVPA